MNMEVDTGASLTLMSETTFSGLWPGRSLQPSQVRLQSYLRETIPVVGCFCVNVDYNGQTCELPLVIVAGSGPTVLGGTGYVNFSWTGGRFTVYKQHHYSQFWLDTLVYFKMVWVH